MSLSQTSAPASQVDVAGAQTARGDLEIRIAVTGTDPGELARLANRTAKTYVEACSRAVVENRLVEIAEDAQIVVTPEMLADGLPEGAGVRVAEMEPRRLKGTSRPQPMAVITLAGNRGSSAKRGRKKRA